MLLLFKQQYFNRLELVSVIIRHLDRKKQKNKIFLIYFCNNSNVLYNIGGRPDRDRMVVRFKSTCTVNVYHY